jgi:hypothetical protein
VGVLEADVFLGEEMEALRGLVDRGDSFMGEPEDRRAFVVSSRGGLGRVIAGNDVPSC